MYFKSKKKLNYDRFVDLNIQIYESIEFRSFSLTEIISGDCGGNIILCLSLFSTIPSPPWPCGKEHCLVRTQMGVAGPLIFAPLTVAISHSRGQCKNAVKIPINDYQIAKAIDDDASPNHNRNIL